VLAIAQDNLEARSHLKASLVPDVASSMGRNIPPLQVAPDRGPVHVAAGLEQAGHHGHVQELGDAGTGVGELLRDQEGDEGGLKYAVGFCVRARLVLKSPDSLRLVARPTSDRWSESLSFGETL